MSNNSLFIHSSGVDPTLSASEHIVWCHDFMAGFVAHSPWQIPFSVSGTKPRHGNLGIEADLSNFEAMCTLAQSDSKNNGFRNIGSNGDNRLLPGSYAASGFSSSFSDGYDLKKSSARCHITLTSPGYLETVNPFSKLAFWCNKFEKEQVNEKWSSRERSWGILRFFITRFRFCIDAGTTSRHCTEALSADLICGARALPKPEAQ